MQRPLTIAVFALLHVLLCAPNAFAQNDAAAEFWLAKLRQAYSTAPIAEEIVVTVRQAAERDVEVVSYRSQRIAGFREPEIMIDLGTLELWTRPPGESEEGPGLVRAAHELDYQTYFEAEPVGRTTLQTLRGAVPPLIIPHVALSLGGERFPVWGSVAWMDAREERSGVGPATVELIGEAEHAQVTLTLVDEERPRLTAVEIRSTRSSTRISMRCEALEVPEGRVGYDTRRRERVESLSDLRERPGDLRPGDPLPDLSLVHFTLDVNEKLSESYLQRLLLYYDGHASIEGVLPENAAIGLDALRLARDEVGPTVRMDAIGVLDPVRNEERHIQNIELDMDKAIDPDPAFYTYNERRTLRRFIPDGMDAIVVASKDGTIAGIIDLGDASARAEDEGRAKVVAELSLRVEELCRLIARRDRGLE